MDPLFASGPHQCLYPPRTLTAAFRLIDAQRPWVLVPHDHRHAGRPTLLVRAGPMSKIGLVDAFGGV